jgi:hypothetical protein
MAATVIVNGRTVVHKDSGGKAISVPDFCKTPTPPGAPVPIPYVNVAQSSDTADGSTTVKVDGNPIMLKKSKFSTSKGDEPGSAKGVASSSTSGVAKFSNYSFDVKVQGQNVPRLGDPMSNNGNAPNTAAVSLLQKNLHARGMNITYQELMYLCKIVCEEATKPGARSNRAASRIARQRTHSRIRSDTQLPKGFVKRFGCKPDFMIMAGSQILAVGDFKWIVSNDRFRGDQLKRMTKIMRKKPAVLNEKVCGC